MYLIIYGPEGSGKGTQANLLKAKLNLPVITSGDLVRAKAKKNHTVEGKICRKALETGQYVPDYVMFKLWREKLESSESQKGFILDGFPRNIHQAQFLERVISKLNYCLDKFIYLKLSDRKSRSRLLKRNRKVYEGSSISHDTPERINQRLRTYHQMEHELVEFFQKKGLLAEINGEQSVEMVFQDILAKLNLNI
ncbi:hypothetical protein A3I51_05770 [Candidatus Gottesmanbacteria bacterium RIFCSPLOWO2_02_FULL_38_8]|uniref:Adenylate kinase n=1 Tax=Candidatus Gottesmanbacteria bacterium RIFCSPLOWO2_02_FULL_38_8 TaxID=1798397 RepID=A0A1F6B2G6_9BACT|nr:MAG: hypothetical protein A3I51_05770 [Candidatus Gottesmanbacteria bacterium RIFCSPLOWO2_02_FULL_38_8]